MMSDRPLLRNKIGKGVLLGIAAGLIATLFDSLYMLLPQTYVPYEYPFLLIVTNVCFWASIGSLSGVFLFIFVRKKHNIRKRENFYWVIFFLLPFALLFGLLGKFNEKQLVNPGFDNNLVFLWVIIFIICVSAIKKRTTQHETVQDFFIAETLSIIALFHLCSNINQLPVVQESFGYFFKIDFLKDNARWSQLYNRFCLVLYCIVTFLIFVLYNLMFVKNKISRLNSVRSLIILCLTAVVLLILFYKSNRSGFLEQYHAIPKQRDQEMAYKIPSVILIVLDTVRKHSVDQHIEFFDNLRVLQQESLVFDNCIANSSWTIPSHAALFTGFYPHEHGCHGMLDSNPWFDGFPPPRPLEDKFVTLAELFSAHGYYTAAIVSNFEALQPGYGLKQGFQIYDYSKSIGSVFEWFSFKPLCHVISFMTNISNKFSLPYRTAEDINEAIDYLLQYQTPGPFFLFINYMDAHDPYRPNRGFYTYFLNHSFPNLFTFFKKIAFRCGFSSRDSICSLNQSLYKGEIAYLDYYLGRLFERLKKRGVYDDSLIIVTSDHGELFCEHGLEKHKVPLYENVIRIPLLIKYPHNQVTGSEQRYITLTDLYPSILSVCGLSFPTEISGKVFWESTEPVVAEFYNYDIGAHRCLYDGNYKLMIYEKGKDPELYDLEADPLEKNNLAKLLPAKVAEMENLLAEWIKNHPPRYQNTDSQMNEVSPSIKDDLKALGYIE